MLATWLFNAVARFDPLRGHGAVVLVAGGLLFTSWGDSAQAVTNTLVNDTWKDGVDTDPASPQYAENNGFIGTDADADGDLESAWFQGGTGSLNPVGENGPLRGNLAETSTTSSASWTTFFTPETTPVNLAESGDSVKITWDFSLTNVNASNGSQGFRVALVDTPDGNRLTANGSPGSAVYAGYAMFMNMGATLGNSSPFRLMRRGISAAGDLMSTSGNWAAIGTTGATSGRHGYDAATPYSFTWEITRNASDGLDHVVRMSGGTLDDDGLAEVVFTDTDPVSATNFGSFAFDTFAVRPSSADITAHIIDTSLFKVEFTTSAAPPVLLGDYNGNGTVDAADYVLWRNGGPLQNDPTPESVGPDDFTFWKANFGRTLGSGAGGNALSGSFAVPEPAAGLLAGLGFAAIALRRRRK